MKRWIILAAAMLLAGCSQVEAPLTGEEIASLFVGDHTAVVELTAGNLEMTADLTRTGSMTEVSITSPEHLRGLRFTPDGIRFGELSAVGEMPAASVGAALDEVMDAISFGELQPDENGSVRGCCGGGSYLLMTENGQPLSLELPAFDLKMQYIKYNSSNI